MPRNHNRLDKEPARDDLTGWLILFAPLAGWWGIDYLLHAL